jgi:hypothetical protein
MYDNIFNNNKRKKIHKMKNLINEKHEEKDGKTT